MPTSPLKRQSAGGGRLRRLLASLRPPARAGPLPVQTGFPTSLADIVVKNHGRLRNPRRRHRAAAPPPAAASEPAPVPQAQERRELSVAHDAAATAAVPVTARPGKGVGGFSIRPGLLAAGCAVALALLVIWSKQLVAAATLASVALSWIEYVRTVRDRRPEAEKMMDSPIREAAESPRSGCCECVSDDGGSDAASFLSADSGCDDSSPVNTPRLKQRRRSLRKLIANKLRNGKTPRGTDSRHGGDADEHEHEHECSETPTPQPPEAIADDDRCHYRCGGVLPLPALVPIILAGLVAGKLPALALAVLCAAFSSSVERVAAGRQASR